MVNIPEDDEEVPSQSVDQNREKTDFGIRCDDAFTVR